MCGRIEGCFLQPRLAAAPMIMAINNPVKGEQAHFQNEGSRYFARAMKALRFKPSDVYYTSPLKCVGREQSKRCMVKCFDVLRREIEVVKPKLILCFASNVLGLLGMDQKATIRSLHGEVVYNKDFDAYVLFSYSPQYAYYNEEVQEAFWAAMYKVREIVQA